MYTMSIQFDHNVFQIGVGEKLALSLDTSDTLVALVAILFIWNWIIWKEDFYLSYWF